MEDSDKSNSLDDNDDHHLKKHKKKKHKQNKKRNRSGSEERHGKKSKKKCKEKDVEDMKTSAAYGNSSTKQNETPQSSPNFLQQNNTEPCSSSRLPINNDEDTDSIAACGPALPPHMLSSKDNDNSIESPKQVSPLHLHRKTTTSSSPSRRIMGPQLPSNAFQLLNANNAVSDENSSDDEDIVGPLPNVDSMSTAQLELEKRALEIKLASLTGDSGNQAKAKVREEWMLELPEVNSLKSLGPTARKFQTKERPDFSDRSSWTDTPESKTKKKIPEKTIAEKAADYHEKEADKEQESLAKKHKAKNKRDESLVDMHQKKLKEKKKKSDQSEKPERRPFSREVDLQVNRFDKSKTDSIIKKARLLDTRFSSGNKKYL